MMSKQDKDLLERQRARLIKDISLEDGMLLAHLRARGAITREKEEYIKSVPDKIGRAGRLLDSLQKGDSDTMEKLLYSLQKTGQTLVVDSWLRLPKQKDTWEPSVDADSAGTSSANPLSQTDRVALERNRPYMMQRLSLEDGNVLGQLRARGILEDTEESYIRTLRQGSGNSNAVGYLVDVLLRKSSDAMEALLHTLNQTGHSHIVQNLRPPRTEDTLGNNYTMGGSSTAELVAALRRNMEVRLKDWRTDLEEGVRDQRGQHFYVQQPCTYTTRGTQSEEQSFCSSTIGLVEKSSPGDRIIVFGEAGMGKTTLLKQVARSWIDKSNATLVSKFKFVFLIPMRLIGNISLLRIICEELELMPESSLRDLEKSLKLNPTEVLFLLDSFEELGRKVANEEIDNLIFKKGKNPFFNSTVILTTRPGSKLDWMSHEKKAKLEDLPKEEVTSIIKESLDANEETLEEVIRSFPATSFLQRPINLALFLFVLRNGKRTRDSVGVSQVELLNEVLQYLMLAYAKKRGFEEFDPKPGSYLQNKDIPRDVTRLFRDIAKTCYEERRQNNVILHVRDDGELKDYLSFGLFTAGQGGLSVVLPHQLFQEYFAAAHLAEDPKAWRALFEEIKVNSEYESPRSKRSGKSETRSLIKVLESMQLENVVRFVAALAPEEVNELEDNAVVAVRLLDKIRTQLGSLFVTEQSKQSFDGHTYYLPVNVDYHTDLIRECRSESGKRILAAAFVTAPVVVVGTWFATPSTGLPVVLPYLDYNQCVTFLKKMYKLILSVTGRRSLLSCVGGGKTVAISDTFVLALVCRYDCTIAADKLILTGLRNRLDLPATMLTRLTTGCVNHLVLSSCKLHAGIPDYMSDLDMEVRVEVTSSQQHQASVSLTTVELTDVEGLQHCHVVTPRRCQLRMHSCEVTVRTLKTCFPKSELESTYVPIVHETEEELISWLETVHLVRKKRPQDVNEFIMFAAQHEGVSLNVCRLLSVLDQKADVHRIKLRDYRLLLNVSESFNTVVQRQLSFLSVLNCQGGVDLDQLLDVCSWRVALRALEVKGSRLLTKARGARSPTVQQNKTLEEFSICDCTGDLVQLLVIFSRCSNLKTVTMDCNEMLFDDDELKLIKPMPGLREFLYEGSYVRTPEGQELDFREIYPHFQKVFPSAVIFETFFDK